MTSIQDHVANLQKAFCVERGVAFVPAPGESILGFANGTRGQTPINGLRHPLVENTNGWYLWCGTEYSTSADFFAPTHAKHIYEEFPSISKLLGLPPGYRFLAAGDYVDVWYDEKLLNI
jgi:hypothetical protein